MRKSLLLALASGLLLGGWGLWAATAGSPKEPKKLKPVVVVSHASFDKMLDNAAMLGRATGNPELAKELIVLLKLVAIQQGLTGPDKERPWGAVVQADGDELTGCAFVPSADLAKLAALVEPFVGKAEPMGGGVYKIRCRAKPVYVKQKDGWALFAYSPEALDTLPADPVALLDGLNAQYDVAVRVYAANIPPTHREKFIECLRKHIDRCAAQGRHEPDQLYALRKQVGETVLQSVNAVVNDAETVTVGWTLDTAAQKTYVEVGVTAKEGTGTARALAGVYGVKSQFGGFRLPGAAFVGNWAGQMPSPKSSTLDSLVEAFRVLAVERIEKDGSRVEEGKAFVADLMASAVQTVNSGRVDGGMALLLKPDAVTLLAGGYVADGAKLTDAVKLIAKVAAQEKPAVAEWIKLDADECRSVHLHTLSIPIPPNARQREKIVSLIGEKLEVAIGIGPQSAYVAAGREPLKVLKQVIEQSAADGAQNVPPVEFSLAVGTTAKFIAAAAKREKVRAVAAVLAAALEPAAGRDHLKLTAISIPRGVKYRLEVEEGLLKLIGRLTPLITGEAKQN